MLQKQILELFYFFESLISLKGGNYMPLVKKHFICIFFLHFEKRFENIIKCCFHIKCLRFSMSKQKNNSLQS